MDTDSISVAREFVEAINRGDLEAMARLMPEDHCFVDSDGSRYQGRQSMIAGWEGYFRMFPDYRITVEEAYSQGPAVVMLGTAAGTYAAGGGLLPEDRWRVPAAWRAAIRDGKVLEWRVYVNVEPVREIMARHGRRPGA